MNRENTKSLVILILLVFVLGLTGLFVYQYSNLNRLVFERQTQKSQNSDVQTSTATLNYDEKISSNISVDSENVLNSACPRARVLNDYEYNSDGSVKRMFYSVLVDGKKISGSVVNNSVSRIADVQVSGDCKSVAWVEASASDLDESGNYIKPEKVRIVSLNGQIIKDFILPNIGPATLVPFNSDTIVVKIGPSVVNESDVPSEEYLSQTFFSIDVNSGKINKIGGPFLMVSPDLKKTVKKVGLDIVLQNTITGKNIVLAKGDGEFAYDYTFSPDSNNLAYLWLSGDRDTIFSMLFRPIKLDNQTILSGKLKIQPVDGNKEHIIIQGGYGVENGWQVDRWLSSSTLQYFQPEYSFREYKVDFSTNPPNITKQGLVDWDENQY